VGVTRLQERRRTGISGNASWSAAAEIPACALRFGYSAWQRLLCSLPFASVRCGGHARNGGSERNCVQEAAHPAVAAERIRLVIDISDGGEGPAAADVSFLDLVVVAFDVGSEPVEVVA
jgi:hypothetical protein